MSTIVDDNVDRLWERYAAIMPDAKALRTVAQLPLPQTFWVNTLKASSERVCAWLQGDGVSLRSLPWRKDAFELVSAMAPSLGRHWLYLSGLLHIQEAVSMLPVHMLAHNTSARVLDMCAAPGNKTAQLAVKMQNKGCVLANDINYNRLRALGQIAKRLSLVNVSVGHCDAAQFPMIDNFFDQIIVDVPCSCEGTFRKSQRKVVQPSGANSRRMAQLQLRILQRAFHLCAPGGVMVYSTCTFSPEENEGVVDALLRSHPGQVSVEPIEVPHLVSSSGLSGWRDQVYDPALQGAMRIWPHQNNTGGFFLCVLRKEPSDASARVLSAPSSLSTPSNSVRSHLAALQERFDFDPLPQADYAFACHSQRGMYMHNRDNAVLYDHRLSELSLDVKGLFCMKTKIKYPKLTTSAAMLLGASARANSLALTAEQREAYLRGEDCVLTSSQVACCTGMGYVIVQYDQVVLGVGLFFPHIGEAGVLRSLFPRYLQGGESSK